MRQGHRMRRVVWAAVVVAAIVIALAYEALSHGDAEWIARGGYTNGAGETCCGKNDCHMVPSERVTVRPDGYLVQFESRGNVRWEFIPMLEAKQSEDAHYWRCAVQGKRRCFFAPPGMT